LFSAAGFTNSEEQDNARYKANNIDGSWTQLPTKLTDRLIHVDDGAGWSGIFITKKCKDPGRAIKFMEFMWSEEGSKLTNWGIEGNHYTLDSNGFPVWSEQFTAMRADHENMIRQTGISAWQFAASGIYEAIRNYNPGAPSTLNCLLDWKSVYHFRPWFQQILPTVDTDESNILTRLRELDNNSIIQLMVANSEAEFNRGFDEMMSRAEGMGMRDLEAWLTKRYTEVYARYN